MIYQYRHETTDFYKVSINDAFAVTNLNTLVDTYNQKQTNLIEDIYDKYFESSAAYAVQKIINDLQNPTPSGKDFTIEDYLCLLRFAILSIFRTPYSLNAIHHAAKVNAYAIVMMKQFIDHGRLDLPYNLDIERGFLFNFLEDFDKSTKLLADLKLTIYYHRVKDNFFIIPDKYAIMSSPNNCNFGDKELKIYFPISSNVLVCLERINRDFLSATCEIDEVGIEQFNHLFIKNTYETIGCEDQYYLKSFIEKLDDKIKPLKKFNPNDKFTDEIQQIKFEIISKLGFNNRNMNTPRDIILHFNGNHEFKILTKSEYKKQKRELNSIYDIKKRKLRF